ncbi:MAG TPA: SURF1 family protein [Gammaproteobacteria bacterium]|nr:SURF1 family protein [Gammaproteobacteria bacterium]
MSTVARNPRKQWAAVVLLVAVGLVCVRLGLWQLHRAEQSRTTIDGFAAAAAAAPLEDLPSRASDDLRFRRIELEGHYVPQRQFLIDNVVQDGEVGYYVLTPFAPVDSDRWVIVNRGWVVAPPLRDMRPAVPIDTTKRTISGRLAPLPSPGLRLGKPAPDNANDPLPVLSYPTMTDLEQRLGKTLYGFQVELDADRPDGFKRAWAAPVVMSPARHLGYVGQWWAFAAIAFGIAVVLGLRELRSPSGAARR